MTDFNTIYDLLDTGLEGLREQSFKLKSVDDISKRLQDLKIKYEIGILSTSDVQLLVGIKNEVEVLMNLWLFYHTDHTLSTWLKPD